MAGGASGAVVAVPAVVAAVPDEGTDRSDVGAVDDVDEAPGRCGRIEQPASTNTDSTAQWRSRAASVRPGVQSTGLPAGNALKLSMRVFMGSAIVGCGTALQRAVTDR